MKKHIFRIMIVMLFACLGLTAFVACAPEENKETFTVTYAAGEGTGTGPASEKHAEGETFTVAENTFTYEGYTFKTWNDGTKDVAAGATYTMPAKDVTFTAKWTKNATPAEKVTVTFSLGDYTTGTAPDAQQVEKGAQVTLPEAPAWAGHVFAGWKVGTNAALKQAGDKIKVSENVTITAQWTEEVTVTFSLGEGVTGNPPASQTVAKNGEITLPAEPTRSGYDFVGWKVGNEVKAAGDKITVTASMTVTAQWDASIVGYWSATGLDLAIPEMTGACDVEIAVERDGSDHIYVVLNLTNGQTSHLDAFYIEKVGSAWQYYDSIGITLQDGKLHVKIQTVDIDLATHTAFTDEFTPTGTYSATVNGSEHYMDFDQWGYDSGNGYMDDVDFVTVGKYVAVFESTQDDVLSSLTVLIEGESGAILECTENGGFTTFTACEAREKTFAFTSLELEEDDGRVYLIGNGTYTGRPASQFLALMEDHDDDQLTDETGKVGIGFNLSFFCLNNRDYEKTGWENVENTASNGTFTVKLDVTDLNLENYAVLANNSGHGDINFPAATDEKVVTDNKIYTLQGAAGAAAYLVVSDHSTDWTDVSATPMTITLTLNDAKDKVLLTVGGTYTGTTKEHMKELLSQNYNDLPIIYFWGQDNNTQFGKDLVITTTDTEWTIQVDVTELKSDIYDNKDAKENLIPEGTVIQNATPGDGINGRPGTSPGISTEFQVKSVVDTTVECGGRAFTLVRSGLYGHNTLYVGTPVTVTYDLGGWAEGTAPAPVKVARSAKVVLAKPDAREGYFFKGWKVGTDETLKKAGEVIDATDVTVTAVWASDAVSGIWTYTKDGDTTKLYVENCEGGVIVVLETKSGKEAMFFAVGEDGWKCGSKTLTVDGNNLVLKSEQTTTFTGRTAFAAGDTVAIPEGVYHYMAAEKEALYVDFGYEAIDLGEGYLDDAELATVGKFVVALVEKDGVKQGPVFEVVSGSITAYNATASMALTTCEARAKNVTYTSFKLESAEDKVYLTVEGVYSGFTVTELRALQEDAKIDQYNISVFLKGGANGHTYTVYPNPNDASGVELINRILTVGQGKISARFNVTDLPLDGGTGYGVASQNDGYGDLSYGSVPANYEFKIGEKKYTLQGSSGVVVLRVQEYDAATDWTGVTAAVTSISLALDNEDAAQATKVLLTYEGTYSGCTKEAMKSHLEAKYGGNTFFYFWGATSHADPVKDFTVTVGEGTWKIVIDVTDLPVEKCRNLCGFSGVNGSSITTADLKYDASIVKENSITFNGKTYSLVLSNGWGNNGLNVAAAE